MTRPELQRCPRCDVTKTLKEFDKGARPNGASSYCKACKYVYHVCRTYKISVETYNLLVSRADGLCECCGEVPTRLVVDHDHDTGEVRGLICDRCNQFIGSIETRPNIFQLSKDYLERYH